MSIIQFAILFPFRESERENKKPKLKHTLIRYNFPLMPCNHRDLSVESSNDSRFIESFAPFLYSLTRLLSHLVDTKRYYYYRNKKKLREVNTMREKVNSSFVSDLLMPIYSIRNTHFVLQSCVLFFHIYFDGLLSSLFGGSNHEKRQQKIKWTKSKRKCFIFLSFLSLHQSEKSFEFTTKKKIWRENTVWHPTVLCANNHIVRCRANQMKSKGKGKTKRFFCCCFVFRAAVRVKCVSND